MTFPNSQTFAQIEAFLTQIGIPIQRSTLIDETFLPGILIDRGRLIIDLQKLAYPGDILHEAGHIAVTSATERPLLGGNITINNPQKEGDELAVLLWTYAACRQINTDPSVVFHPMGYKGQSDWLIDQFERGQYMGLPLLVWMGLTTTDGFPAMQRWLRL